MSLQPLVTTRGVCDIPPDSKICPDACLAALKQIKSVADEVRFVLCLFYLLPCVQRRQRWVRSAAVCNATAAAVAPASVVMSGNLWAQCGSAATALALFPLL